MPNEVTLYEVIGGIQFEDGRIKDIVKYFPATDVLAARQLFLKDIEFMKENSITAQALTGQKVAGGEVYDCREIDVSRFGYSIRLERIVKTNPP